MTGTKFVSLHVTASNQTRDVRALLDSLEAQDVAEWQATIVDRASQGGDVLDGRTPNPSIVVLRNFNDQGFCRAQNQALALAMSRLPAEDLASCVMVIAHPDIVLAPNAVQKILEAFTSDPDLMVGIPPLYQAKRVVGDDMERMDIETSEVVDHIGLTFAKSRRLKPGLSLQAKAFSPSDVCGVFRASALAEVKSASGWLDPALPAGQAVVDLTWRMRLQGMKVATLPDVRIWHTPHGATVKGMARVWNYWTDMSRRERLDRQTGCLCAKNDVIANRVVHAPWIFGAWFMRLLQTIADPGLLLGRLKTFPVWLACWNERGDIQKKTRVTSKEARTWFA